MSQIGAARNYLVMKGEKARRRADAGRCRAAAKLPPPRCASTLARSSSLFPMLLCRVLSILFGLKAASEKPQSRRHIQEHETHHFIQCRVGCLEANQNMRYACMCSTDPASRPTSHISDCSRELQRGSHRSALGEHVEPGLFICAPSS